MMCNPPIRLPIFSISLFLALFAGMPALAQTQGTNPLLGSVPTGSASGTLLELSLHDALERALQYNLAAIDSHQNTRVIQAARLSSLNALLPNLTARISSSLEQIDLKTLGFNLSIPGIHIPYIAGPFAVQDSRVFVSESIFNRSDIKNWKAASESEKASQSDYRRARELVVLTTGQAYLLVISDSATIESIRARVQTAQTLYQNDQDLNRQGVIARIDTLRAQVELQTEQQRLISAENQLSIDKLTLGRIIGLPNGQDFHASDSVPYAPLSGLNLEASLREARELRPDYQSAAARVLQAELAREAAGSENYPSLAANAAYGDIGNPNFVHSHGTFSLAVGLSIPIYQGSRVRADKLAADAALEQRKSELADLDGKIDDEVRTAFFNFRSSSELVTVARSNVDLASETLKQAQDRFRSGVADNLEVVQAQESVAGANQSYIASLYSFNLSKLSLALALGVAEQSALQYLGVK